MRSAITGVAPSQLVEVTIRTVWPSTAMFPPARALSRLYSIRAGWGIFKVGNLFMLLAIPLALAMYFFRLLPWVIRRYTLTNRRLIVQQGIFAKPERWVELDDYDTIEIDVLPGQEWYRAGQLIFRNGDVETFRLAAVPYPDSFRHTCLAARNAFVEVQRICAEQRPAEEPAAV